MALDCRKPKGLIALIVLAVTLAGCVNPLHEATYARYTEIGDAALANGRPDVAEEAYYRAARNVDWGNLSDAQKSGSRFNLANAKIRLEKFAEAEPLLLESLALEKKISGPQHRFTVKRYFGLAIVYFELGQQEKGLEYLRNTQVMASDPEFEEAARIWYPKYADWLSDQGRDKEAQRLREIVQSMGTG